MNDRPWPLEPRRYYPLLNTTIMTQDYETDLLSAVATEVCDELFSVAERDPKIMVNNWCAFAVLAIFREVSLILGGAAIPTLDECMDGGHTPQCLLRSAKWGQLMSWHEEHWQKSLHSITNHRPTRSISLDTTFRHKKGAPNRMRPILNRVLNRAELIILQVRWPDLCLTFG